jgi:hypothetical protein
MQGYNRPALPTLDDDVRTSLPENDTVEPAAREQLEQSPTGYLSSILDRYSAFDQRENAGYRSGAATALWSDWGR